MEQNSVNQNELLNVALQLLQRATSASTQNSAVASASTSTRKKKKRRKPQRDVNPEDTPADGQSNPEPNDRRVKKEPKDDEPDTPDDGEADEDVASKNFATSQVRQASTGLKDGSSTKVDGLMTGIADITTTFGSDAASAVEATINFYGVNVGVINPLWPVKIEPKIKLQIATMDLSGVVQYTAHTPVIRQLKYAPTMVGEVKHTVESITEELSKTYYDLSSYRNCSTDEATLINNAVAHLQTSTDAILGDTLLSKLWTPRVAATKRGKEKESAISEDLAEWLQISTEGTMSKQFSSPMTSLILGDYIDETFPGEDITTINRMQIASAIRAIAIIAEVAGGHLTRPLAFNQTSRLECTTQDYGWQKNEGIWELFQSAMRGNDSITCININNARVDDSDGFVRPMNAPAMKSKSGAKSGEDCKEQTWLLFRMTDAGGLKYSETTPWAPLSWVDTLNNYYAQITSGYEFVGGSLVMKTSNFEYKNAAADRAFNKCVEIYTQKILHVLFTTTWIKDQKCILLNRILFDTLCRIVSDLFDASGNLSASAIDTRWQKIFSRMCGTRDTGDWPHTVIFAMLHLFHKELGQHWWTYSNEGDFKVLEKHIKDFSAPPTDNSQQNSVVQESSDNRFLETPSSKYCTYICEDSQAQSSYRESYVPSANMDIEVPALKQAGAYYIASSLLSERIMYYRTGDTAKRASELISKGLIASLATSEAPSDEIIDEGLDKAEALFIYMSTFMRSLSTAQLQTITDVEKARLDSLCTAHPLVKAFPNFDALTSITTKNFIRTASIRPGSPSDFEALYNHNAQILEVPQLHQVSLGQATPFVDTEKEALFKIANGIIVAPHKNQVPHLKTVQAIDRIKSVFEAIKLLIDFIETGVSHKLYESLNTIYDGQLRKTAHRLIKAMFYHPLITEGIANNEYDGLIKLADHMGEAKVTRRIGSYVSIVNCIVDARLTALSAGIQLLLGEAQWILHVYSAHLTQDDTTVFPFSSALREGMKVSWGFDSAIKNVQTLLDRFADFFSVDGVAKSTAYTDAQVFEYMPKAYVNFNYTEDDKFWLTKTVDLSDFIGAIESSQCSEAIRSITTATYTSRLQAAEAKADQRMKLLAIAIPVRGIGQRWLALQTLLKRGCDVSVSAMGYAVPQDDISVSGLTMPRDVFEAYLGDTTQIDLAHGSDAQLAIESAYKSTWSAVRNNLKRHSTRISPIEQVYYKQVFFTGRPDHIDDILPAKNKANDDGTTADVREPFERVLWYTTAKRMGFVKPVHVTSLPVILGNLKLRPEFAAIVNTITINVMYNAVIHRVTPEAVEVMHVRHGEKRLNVQDICHIMNIDPNFLLTGVEARALVKRLNEIATTVDAYAKYVKNFDQDDRKAYFGEEARTRWAGEDDISLDGEVIPDDNLLLQPLNDSVDEIDEQKDYTMMQILQGKLADAEGTVWVKVINTAQDTALLRRIEPEHCGCVCTTKESLRFGGVPKSLKFWAALTVTYPSTSRNELPFGIIEKILSKIYTAE